MRVRPRIIWTGVEFAVVWVQSGATTQDIMIRRLDAGGVPKGPAVPVGQASSTVAELSVVWSPVYQGYVLSYLGTFESTLYMRRIGRDGSQLEPVKSQRLMTASLSSPISLATAVATDGRIAALTNAGFDALLSVMRADGAQIANPLKLGAGAGWADILASGTSWIESWQTPSAIQLNQGTTAAPVDLVAGTDLKEVKLELDRGVITAAWTQGFAPYEYHFQRSRIGAAGKPMQAVTSDVSLTGGPVVPGTEDIDLATIDATSFAAVWIGNETPSHEVHYARVGVTSCL